MTIATPYTPRSKAGRNILAGAIRVGPSMSRRWLAGWIRQIRSIEGRTKAQHCLAWLDWLGAYPIKSRRNP